MLLKDSKGNLFSTAKIKIKSFKDPELDRRRKYDIDSARALSRRFDDLDIVDTFDRTEALTNGR